MKHKLNKWRGEEGFSLIEIVVAVGILAILSTLGVVAYASYVDYAREGAVKDAASKVLVGAIAYEQDGSKATVPHDAVNEYLETQDGNKIAVDLNITERCIEVVATHEEGNTATRSAGDGCENSNGGNSGEELPEVPEDTNTNPQPNPPASNLVTNYFFIDISARITGVANGASSKIDVFNGDKLVESCEGTMSNNNFSGGCYVFVEDEYEPGDWTPRTLTLRGDFGGKKHIIDSSPNNCWAGEPEQEMYGPVFPEGEWGNCSAHFTDASPVDKGIPGGTNANKTIVGEATISSYFSKLPAGVAPSDMAYVVYDNTNKELGRLIPEWDQAGYDRGFGVDSRTNGKFPDGTTIYGEDVFKVCLEYSGTAGGSAGEMGCATNTFRSDTSELYALIGFEANATRSGPMEHQYRYGITAADWNKFWTDRGFPPNTVVIT